MNSIDIIIIMNYTDKRNSLFFASLFACFFFFDTLIFLVHPCLLLVYLLSLLLLLTLLLIVWLGAFSCVHFFRLILSVKVELLAFQTLSHIQIIASFISQNKKKTFTLSFRECTRFSSYTMFTMLLFFPRTV